MKLFTMVAWSTHESLRTVRLMIEYAGDHKYYLDETQSPECNDQCHYHGGPCAICNLPYVTDGSAEVTSKDIWETYRFVARKLGKGLFPAGAEIRNDFQGNGHVECEKLFSTLQCN